MDTGAAGHVMPAEIVAANGERIQDLGEKTIPFQSVEGVHRRIKFRSANVAKPLISRRKVVQAGNVVVLDERNPHIRNNRDNPVIKLGANSGVYTMDMCVRPGTKCNSEGEEGHAEQESNGLEEGEDAMTDEEGEGEAATADWRVRAGPRNKPTDREREEHEATHMPFPRLVHTQGMMGRGRTHHHMSKKR